MVLTFLLYLVGSTSRVYNRSAGVSSVKKTISHCLTTPLLYFIYYTHYLTNTRYITHYSIEKIESMVICMTVSQVMDIWAVWRISRINYRKKCHRYVSMSDECSKYRHRCIRKATRRELEKENIIKNLKKKYQLNV